MSGQNSLTSKEHSDYWKDKAKGPGLFDWIRDKIKPKQSLAQVDQKFTPAQQFAGDFIKDPRAAYRKHGAADINKLMDEAISKGWLKEMDRKTMWNLKEQSDRQAKTNP